jgi:hypothetical protein
MKNLNDPIGKQTRDIAACSEVPPRAPQRKVYNIKLPYFE